MTDFDAIALPRTATVTGREPGDALAAPFTGIWSDALPALGQVVCRCWSRRARAAAAWSASAGDAGDAGDEEEDGDAVMAVTWLTPAGRYR